MSSCAGRFARVLVTRAVEYGKLPSIVLNWPTGRIRRSLRAVIPPADPAQPLNLPLRGRASPENSVETLVIDLPDIYLTVNAQRLYSYREASARSLSREMTRRDPIRIYRVSSVFDHLVSNLYEDATEITYRIQARDSRDGRLISRRTAPDRPGLSRRGKQAAAAFHPPRASPGF